MMDVSLSRRYAVLDVAGSGLRFAGCLVGGLVLGSWVGGLLEERRANAESAL